MSEASKRAAVNQDKEINAWKDQAAKQKALELAVSLVRTQTYDPKNIAKDAQVFYQFLKGTTK